MNYLKIKDLSVSNKGFYGIGASSINYNDSFPQYLRITDIGDDRGAPLNIPTCIDPNIYPNWKQFLLRENDIVFARTGNSTGRNYFCNKIYKDTVFAGFLIKFSIKPELILPRYVGYYCQSQSYWNQIKSLFTGSTRANVNAEQYANLLIPVVDKSTQQHIVNTIGSVDDLIENLQQQQDKIVKLCLTKINSLSSEQCIKLQKIATFLKGIEIGSKQYFESYEKGLISYYRVGDLLKETSTVYLNPVIKHQSVAFNDVLISLDGSPGRISTGCEGAYSSGIQKIITQNKFKGLIFFALNGKLNQEIIKNHSIGTTILHATKAVPYLLVPELDESQLYIYNTFFSYIILLKKKIIKLKKIKNILLAKYF